MQVGLLCLSIIATGHWEWQASPLGASTHRETAAVLFLARPRHSCSGGCCPSKPRVGLHWGHHRLVPLPAAQSSSPHFTTVLLNLIQRFYLFNYLRVSICDFCFFFFFALWTHNCYTLTKDSYQAVKPSIEGKRENSTHLTQWHTQEVKVLCKKWRSFMTRRSSPLTLWIRQVSMYKEMLLIRRSQA